MILNQQNCDDKAVALNNLGNKTDNTTISLLQLDESGKTIQAKLESVSPRSYKSEVL